MKQKYQPLKEYLNNRCKKAQRVTLSFAEIEGILGDRLPQSAYNHRAWWSNQSDVSNRPQAKAWISAGYEVETVQQQSRSGTVRFRRRHAGLDAAQCSPDQSGPVRFDRSHAWRQPMNWTPEAIIEDFRSVARLAGVNLGTDDIGIEILPAPHRPPTRLPPGKMAVYVFCKGDRVLKIGKAGSKSQPRYTSQHYNPRSVSSTLAHSLLDDRETFGAAIDEGNVKQWIKTHTGRINFLLDAGYGIAVLTLLEAFLQCRLKPRYEGFKSQT